MQAVTIKKINRDVTKMAVSLKLINGYSSNQQQLKMKEMKLKSINFKYRQDSRGDHYIMQQKISKYKICSLMISSKKC